MGVGFTYFGASILGKITAIRGRSVEITLEDFPSKFSKSKLTVSKKELRDYMSGVLNYEPEVLSGTTITLEDYEELHKQEMAIRHTCCSCPVCVPEKRMIKVD